MLSGAVVADEHTRRVIAQVWRETAVLYLHTVMSDAQPGKHMMRACCMQAAPTHDSVSGVPEILSTIDIMMKHVRTLSASHFDRAMILPFVLAGCLTEDPYMRETIRQRLLWHHDDFYNGSMSQSRTFVDYVHNRRQAARHSAHRANVTVDWRELMCERWSAITLV